VGDRADRPGWAEGEGGPVWPVSRGGHQQWPPTAIDSVDQNHDRQKISPSSGLSGFVSVSHVLDYLLKL
jgi:hypothetical protein